MAEPSERAERTGRAEPSVLVLTRRGDREAGLVATLLRRAGVPVTRLDADAPGGVGDVLCTSDGVLEIAGARIRPTVTWHRHFSPRALPGCADPGGDALRRDAWAALVRQLPLLSQVSIGDQEPGQLAQLRQAASLGLRVPRTVVATDPRAAASALASGRTVVKALDRHYVEPSPGLLRWFPPLVCAPGRTRVLRGTAPGTPLVVQEYVPHDREIRLYLTGTEHHAFEVAKERPEDLWTRPDRVGVAAVATPPPALSAARALAEAFSLRYAAFDFLMQGDDPVFLELNVHGDWRWFERRAGVETVTRAMARTLGAAHRAAGGGVGRRLALLPFLGAGVS
ncbi:ATP-grasp domain-containing protein [Streptacidiphilus jiangxiensis]|uniref:ATP-grasp domain-containing protein n=1 Tax=Streptacidiphilus jiangxiensis TaxID=235985 RepID=A0A1H7MU95_STRJI|nr:hypothetical protein [Streptacidiphilus jiangxiensis]SEL14946.1 hypothetical protein SAMN05414137_10675 [Streptacidiphilus jiangxiensis]